ncbi:penicillin-sensitive transpeptidase [Pseudidiomarina salinarum]|uniref:Penicillin-binding protein 1A n=1 Tax=Pseudidiomarina salinarum TaxID=435908 RepID=A0A094ISM9_9GAMM|nr:penicillin-binding protein 1A [Pseudidiomarina salinarum]KFZ30695.1 penicillin-sensitive transpeptidase [Pseudidiomarina salinarum]RUO69215.1 penicillin-binding protein 1A [Pseudidiomarina salinarum]
MKFVKWSLYSLLGLAVVGVLVVGSLYLYLRADLPSVAELKEVRLQTPMQVYSSDGELIAQFGEIRRIPLKLEEIPQPLINAFLATEDQRFYEHFGIDPIGVGRAFFQLVTSGEIQSGGSTITQQLARNFYLSFEQTWSRKVREAFIALHIESQLTKDEILELYLNKITFGHRAHGVGAAAQVYYGKDIKDLTLAEMAMIAGLPKAPSTMNPISNPERARDRRSVVLGRLLAERMITLPEYRAALAEPVEARLHAPEVTMTAPYLAEMVRAEIVSRYGEDDAYNLGLKVYTTASAKQQRAAQRAVQSNLHAYDERHGYRGAEAELFDADSPWPTEQVTTYLRSVEQIGLTYPAVVMEVSERSARVIAQVGSAIELDWDGLSWARPYMNAERQGPAPKQASDILKVGDQVRIRLTDKGWRLAQVPEPGAAIIALRPHDGGIAAAVGGYSFRLSQYNRAIQAERQVGSNIKPFIYSAALENGFTLATLVNDAPINQWNPGSGVAWRPRNSPDVYEGPIPLREALAKSKNVVSVRLLRAMGISTVVDYLTRFGFDFDELPRNESLSLGSASMTPLEVARGYAVFANGGYLITPYFIERITTATDEVIFAARPAVACVLCEIGEREVLQAPQVITEQNAFLVTQGMNSAVWGGGSWAHKTGWNGTAWRIQRSSKLVDTVGRNIVGKTGTTNDVKDTWFSGFVSGLVTTSWVGFDNTERPLGATSMNANLSSDEQEVSGAEGGAKTALPMWIDFMETAVEDVAAESFDVPPGIVSARIDLETGKLSRESDYTTRFEYFLPGTAPAEFTEGKSSPNVFDDDDDSIF